MSDYVPKFSFTRLDSAHPLAAYFIKVMAEFDTSAKDVNIWNTYELEPPEAIIKKAGDTLTKQGFKLYKGLDGEYNCFAEYHDAIAVTGPCEPGFIFHSDDNGAAPFKPCTLIIYYGDYEGGEFAICDADEKPIVKLNTAGQFKCIMFRGDLIHGGCELLSGRRRALSFQMQRTF